MVFFSRYFSVLLSLSFSLAVCGQRISDPLEEGFDNPPNTAKPRGYWCLVNGNYDLAQMTIELEEFKQMGMGAVDLWDVAGWVDPDGVVPGGPPFMGEESVQAIAYAIREAGRLGLDIGLTVSSSWNAGGDWVDAEDGVKGLYHSVTEVAGPGRVKQRLPFPEVPTKFRNIDMLLEKGTDGLPTHFEEVAVLAMRASDDSLVAASDVLDITDYFKEGILRWKAPEGKWYVVRYVSTGSGQPLMRPSPNSNGLMVDHFSAEAMRQHVSFFFAKLEAELGPLDRTALKYLYTDSYEANSAVWTFGMIQEFERRMGYSLLPFLPVLQGFTVGDAERSQRILHDYARVLSDLIIENHYALATQMCEDRGIGFIAEAGGPGPPIHNVPFESLKSLGSLTVPRGEFWFDPMWPQEKIDGLQIVKGPASAAHLYGQPRVEAEAFTGTQIWQNGPGDLKQTADRALCEGLTMFVYHTSPHITREAGEPGWVYNFGTIVNTTRAWWPHSDGLHGYLGRSSFLLQQGNFVGDVLYYYGDEAPNFVDPKHIDPSLGFGYDYDVVNSDIILNRLDVVDGYYVLPHGQRYKVLVLPDDNRANPQVLQRIKTLVEKGGVLIGEPPNKAYSYVDYPERDGQVQTIAKELWTEKRSSQVGAGRVFRTSRSIRSVLAELDVGPDVLVNGEGPLIDFIHRQTETADIYFVRNLKEERQSFELSLRSTRGHPELWDADTQTRYFHPIFNQQTGYTTLPLTLSPKQSMFVVLRGEEGPTQYVGVRRDGELLFPGGALEVGFDSRGVIFSIPGDYRLRMPEGEVRELSVSSVDIPVVGSWELRFPHGYGTPPRTTWDTLKSWTTADDLAIQHFSGVVSYHKHFEFEMPEGDDRILLDLGDVSKTAKVFLNGHALRTVWYAPYEMDVTDIIRTGKNHLIVDVANVMSNRMTGDARRPWKEKRTHSNITKGPNAWMTPYKDLRLVTSGLLGPVNLKIRTTLD